MVNLEHQLGKKYNDKEAAYVFFLFLFFVDHLLLYTYFGAICYFSKTWDLNYKNLWESEPEL